MPRGCQGKEDAASLQRVPAVALQPFIFASNGPNFKKNSGKKF